MPEGDTVWLAAHRMHAALAGQMIVHSDFRVPQLASADLSGRTVIEVASRGKHLLTRFDDGQTLHTHFRMDGTWHLCRTGERRGAGPRHQIRVVLETADWQAVGYRLPVIELLPTADEDAVVGHLGPDVLGPDWDEAEAVRRLRAHPERAIAAALIDQRNLAGIGNLYKSESLFLSGITPWTEVGAVLDLDAVVRRAHKLLHANKTHWHQSTTGSLRRGEEHWVFERTGRPCRRCGAPVESAEQSEAGDEARARLSYWCPHCQAGPSPSH